MDLSLEHKSRLRGGAVEQIEVEGIKGQSKAKPPGKKGKGERKMTYTLEGALKSHNKVWQHCRAVQWERFVYLHGPYLFRQPVT